MGVIEATHMISAVAYQDGRIELTFEDLETGKTATLEFNASDEDGTALAEIIAPCVYHAARVTHEARIDCSCEHCQIQEQDIAKVIELTGIEDFKRAQEVLENENMSLREEIELQKLEMASELKGENKCDNCEYTFRYEDVCE